MSALTLAWLATWQVKALAFVLLVGACIYGLRVGSAQTRYSILQMMLGVLFVMPILASLAPLYSLPDTWSAPLSRITDVAFARSTVAEPSGAAEHYSIQGEMIIGYFLVSGFLFLRLGVGFYFANREVRALRRMDEARTLQLIDELCRKIDLRRPALLMDVLGTGPYVWGVRDSAIVVPERFALATDQVQRTIIAHELIHIRRRDTVVCLASRAFQCLYWINPIAWWLPRQLQLEMEKSCDDQALQFGTTATDYAAELLCAIRFLNAAGRQPRLAVAMARSTSLSQRINSLLDDKTQRGTMNKLCHTAIAIGMLGLGIAVGSGAANAVTAEASSATSDIKGALSEIRSIAAANNVTELNEDMADSGGLEIRGGVSALRDLSGFMRGLATTVGAPTLRSSVRRSDGVFEFRIYLAKIDRYVPH